MRKRNKPFDSCLNFVDHPIGGIKVVFSDVFPNGVEVNFSLRVKVIPFHR